MARASSSSWIVSYSIFSSHWRIAPPYRASSDFISQSTNFFANGLEFFVDFVLLRRSRPGLYIGSRCSWWAVLSAFFHWTFSHAFSPLPRSPRRVASNHHGSRVLGLQCVGALSCLRIFDHLWYLRTKGLTTIFYSSYFRRNFGLMTLKESRPSSGSGALS